MSSFVGSRQGETDVWRAVMKALSPQGYRLFRNQRYKGPIVSGGKLTGGYADCGVGGDGGADLIGFRIIEVTPEMVGKRIAQFCAIETKSTRGRKESEQITFIDGVRAAGGIAGFARSVAEAENLSK